MKDVKITHEIKSFEWVDGALYAKMESCEGVESIAVVHTNALDSVSRYNVLRDRALAMANTKRKEIGLDQKIVSHSGETAFEKDYADINTCPDLDDPLCIASINHLLETRRKHKEHLKLEEAKNTSEGDK